MTTAIALQLTKLKDRMKVIFSQVQQVERKMEGVKVNKSKVGVVCLGGDCTLISFSF